MDIPVIHPEAGYNQEIAAANRHALRQAGTFAVNLIGGAGCGKTSLIQETLKRLTQTVRIGAITCDPAGHQDADRLARYTDQVAQVDVGAGHLLEARHIQEAMSKLKLPQLELLLIENVGSLVGPAETDLGEDAKATMFSVAIGNDKGDKYADVLAVSDVLILSKVDLLPSVPFDLEACRREVRRFNSTAPLLEMSVLKNVGVDSWIQWLRGHLLRQQQPQPSERPQPSTHWFG